MIPSKGVQPMDSSPDQQTLKKRKISKKRLFLAAVLFVVGFLVLSAGISIFIYNQDTDSQGFVYSNIHPVDSSTHGFTLYMNEYKMSTWGWLGAENIAEMHFIVRNKNPAQELFTGIATTQQSESYRKSFRCEIPTFWRWTARAYWAEISINTTMLEGQGAPISLPDAQIFWRASAKTTDTAVLTYLPVGEQHIWFIMNSDGSPNITADIQIGFKSPILVMLPLVFLPAGIVLFVCGAVVLFYRKKKQNTDLT